MLRPRNPNPQPKKYIVKQKDGSAFRSDKACSHSLNLKAVLTCYTFNNSTRPVVLGPSVARSEGFSLVGKLKL